MKRALTDEQRAKRDERRRRFRSLAKQIAGMTPEERESLAARMIGLVTVEGRALSLHNCCLIYMQREGATMVGGFRQWIKAGRAVRKGEHGMMIWIPSRPRREDGADEGAPEDADAVRFLMGTVFDVTQTDEIAVPAEV